MSDPTPDNRHLDRHVTCRDCSWFGVVGELIAKDKLRCPECDGDDIEYPTANRRPS